MLHGRLGFCFGIVDGPLGGGIRLEGTWREDKVSKQKDTKRANWGVGLAYPVHDVYYTRLTTKRALGLVIRSTSTDTESEYRRRIFLRVWGPDIRYKALLVTDHSSEHSLFGIALSPFRHPSR
ncbi:hypothetical protein V8C43DRAFT_274432 [Trichoderma afarasin]